ncbi:hypothetical protein I4F81_004880 [Pyropia yezoensis]|uniref:Uncharacterized protein n=1 Tax=Pyropia yezoensis TaxID=2788 RepID=A0ACC3BWA5_PYRYE|nr:hypothetical protein I4F81_004880 [Neopyropia yezoensis]
MEEGGGGGVPSRGSRTVVAWVAGEERWGAGVWVSGEQKETQRHRMRDAGSGVGSGEVLRRAGLLPDGLHCLSTRGVGGVQTDTGGQVPQPTPARGCNCSDGGCGPDAAVDTRRALPGQ